MTFYRFDDDKTNFCEDIIQLLFFSFFWHYFKHVIQQFESYSYPQGIDYRRVVRVLVFYARTGFHLVQPNFSLTKHDVGKLSYNHPAVAFQRRLYVQTMGGVFQVFDTDTYKRWTVSSPILVHAAG